MHVIMFRNLTRRRCLVKPRHCLKLVSSQLGEKNKTKQNKTKQNKNKQTSKKTPQLLTTSTSRTIENKVTLTLHHLSMMYNEKKKDLIKSKRYLRVRERANEI